MEKALESLKASNPNGRTSSEDTEINTTHLYIKFKPRDENELAILKRDSTLVLYDYPLDYEIEVTVVFYHDPDVPVDLPTYQYCAVEVDKKLPEGVEYELLEELFIPDDYSDNPEGRRSVDASAEFIARLVHEALKITSNLEEETEAAEEEDSSGKRTDLFKFGCSAWRMAGRIQVWDDQMGRTQKSRSVFVRWEYYNCGGGDSGEPEFARSDRRQCRRGVYRTEYYSTPPRSYVGLEGMKVRIRRWFTTHEGLTDLLTIALNGKHIISVSVQELLDRHCTTGQKSEETGMST